MDYRISEAPATTIFKERGTIPLIKEDRTAPTHTGAPQIISQADKVFTSRIRTFHRLRNLMACVAVIASEVSILIQRLTWTLLRDLRSCAIGGCTKLILDMTNNGGGLVDFAYFINKLFFPEAKHYFVQDQRANAYIQGAAKIVVKHATSTIFHPRVFIRMATGEAFKDASMYTKGVNYKVKGGFSTLPVKSSLNVAVGEIFATKQTTVPLEYDSKYFAANVHLDQDPVSARHPDNTWVRIAKDS